MNLAIFLTDDKNKDISLRIFCLLNLKQCKTLALINKKMNHMITNTLYQLFANFYSLADECEMTETQLKKFRWILKWLYMRNIITLENITEKYLKCGSTLLKPISGSDKKIDSEKNFINCCDIILPLEGNGEYFCYCDVILPLVFFVDDKPASEAGKLIILDRQRDLHFKPIKDTRIEVISKKINDSNSIFIRNDDLYKKINVFFLYNKNKNILLWAIGHGCLDVVQYFIFKTQVKINEYHFGSVALEYASKLGNLEIVRYLISVGVEANNEAITLACAEGHLEVVKYLVSCGSNFSYRDYYSLRIAHTNNHIEVVNYLKSLGEQYIDKALISASKKYNLDIIKHLISLSEKPKITDAFCAAYHGGFFDIARYLKTLICDVSLLLYSLLSPQDINSAIMHASKTGDVDSLKILITVYRYIVEANYEKIIKKILTAALINNRFKIMEYLISVVFLPLISHVYEQVYGKNIKNHTNVNIINMCHNLNNYEVSFITSSVEFIKESSREHRITFSNKKMAIMYPCTLCIYELKDCVLTNPFQLNHNS
jgi:ankyrin repeat protein